MSVKRDDIATGLEVSLKLKDAGVRQESIFYWIEVQQSRGVSQGVYTESEYNFMSAGKVFDFKLLCSAFTIEELHAICNELTIPWIFYWYPENYRLDEIGSYILRMLEI